ncbi:MAG: hypothetical protein QW328_09000 [Nitrososphaerota archaeon]
MRCKSMFEKLSGVYRPLADVLKTSEDTLNSSFTPEIVGTCLEALNEIALTDFGSIVVSLIEAGALLAASAVAPISSYDKEMLVQIASHMITRPVRALTPEKMSMAMAQANIFGRSLASFDTRGLSNTLFKSSYEVESTINRIKDQLESLLSSVKLPFAQLVRAEMVEAPSVQAASQTAQVQAAVKAREPMIY